MFQKFKDRQDAGKKLAKVLKKYAEKQHILLLALPRGGVPVAYEVAQELSLPFDVLLVRKLGVPGNEELAMGAIAQDNVCIINQDIVNKLQISKAAIEKVTEIERTELSRRNQLYRDGRSLPEIKGNTIILIDDGLATGATMKAAIAVLRQAAAKHIIVAIPVGSFSSCREIQDIADDVICLYTPQPFYGVGQWYFTFSQTSDQEVQTLLKNHKYKGTTKK